MEVGLTNKFIEFLPSKLFFYCALKRWPTTSSCLHPCRKWALYRHPWTQFISGENVSRHISPLLGSGIQGKSLTRAKSSWKSKGPNKEHRNNCHLFPSKRNIRKVVIVTIVSQDVCEETCCEWDSWLWDIKESEKRGNGMQAVIVWYSVMWTRWSRLQIQTNSRGFRLGHHDFFL
jgi:hypothetical protein